MFRERIQSRLGVTYYYVHWLVAQPLALPGKAVHWLARAVCLVAWRRCSLLDNATLAKKPQIRAGQSGNTFSGKSSTQAWPVSEQLLQAELQGDTNNVCKLSYQTLLIILFYFFCLCCLWRRQCVETLQENHILFHPVYKVQSDSSRIAPASPLP